MSRFIYRPRLTRTINAAVEVHNTLNPKIWDNSNKLRGDVREKLLDAVDEFETGIELPVKFLDAYIVGSNASFNYTKYSDLDVHCIVNFARIDADRAVTEAWMWDEKKIFNDEYDIQIRGIDVEMYIEDVGSNTVSNGIYSLFKDEWIKFPEPIVVDVDEQEVDEQVSVLIPKIESVLTINDSNRLDEVENMIDELYLIRKEGLATDGEYGVGNQVFKEIRNLGYLDRLKDRTIDLREKQLSI